MKAESKAITLKMFKKKEICYLSLYKNQYGGRKPSIAFVGQLHLCDHHFFINFTFDLFCLQKNGGEIKPKKVYLMNQQMWCLIIEICDFIYNIVFFN